MLKKANGTVRRVSVWLVATAVVLSPVAVPAQAPSVIPQRVVSLGVCADQLLLALADPGQIASLSRDAGNPSISYLADLAAPYPQGTGGAEALVAFAPDLVLADESTSAATLDLIEELGYPTTVLQTVANIDEAIAQILLVGVILGREAEGRNLANLVEAARRQAARTNWGDTAVSIRGDGHVPGDGTLMSDLLSVIGLNNVGQQLSGGRDRVSLEVLIATPPTYLIVPEDGAVPIGGALAMLQHPALAEMFPPAQRMLIPDRLTHCAGPSLPVALRRMASELARVTP